MMNFLDKLIAQLERGEVTFSTHVDVALRVRLALDDPELPIVKAAQIVQAEPFLSARVVAMANSVAFSRDGKTVTDVRTAVTRLGLKFVRVLATAVVMRQMVVNSSSPAARSLGSRLWEHTAHVAALAHLLAVRFNRELADVAMFAGIVHEVGGFYLISRIDEYPELLPETGNISVDDRRILDRAVLTALAIPSAVAAAIDHLWLSEPPGFPPHSLIEILSLADRLTPIASPLSGKTAAEPLVLANGEVDSILAEILDQSGDEMGSLTAALCY